MKYSISVPETEHKRPRPGERREVGGGGGGGQQKEWGGGEIVG